MATYQPGQAGVNVNGSVAGVGTTDTEAGITAPAGTFQADDVGRAVTGTGIPASTTIASVESDTEATLSQAATATGTITMTFGGGDGYMHVAGQFRIKTNDTAVTGVGAESPFPVVGSTIGAQVTRAVVDSKNATNVGVPGGPDPVAPLPGS